MSIEKEQPFQFQSIDEQEKWFQIILACISANKTGLSYTFYADDIIKNYQQRKKVYRKCNIPADYGLQVEFSHDPDFSVVETGELTNHGKIYDDTQDVWCCNAKTYYSYARVRVS